MVVFLYYESNIMSSYIEEKPSINKDKNVTYINDKYTHNTHLIVQKYKVQPSQAGL